MSDNYKQVNVRLPEGYYEEIDRRREQASKAQGREISRNQWFVNCIGWILEELPHQAVHSDLVKAWPGMPPEVLGIDK